MDEHSALRATLAAIDANRDEIVATLSALVGVPSVNPNYPHFEGVPTGAGTGESAANEVLRPVYAAAGCEVATVEEVPGRANATRYQPSPNRLPMASFSPQKEGTLMGIQSASA